MYRIQMRLPPSRTMVCEEVQFAGFVDCWLASDMMSRWFLCAESIRKILGQILDRRCHIIISGRSSSLARQRFVLLIDNNNVVAVLYECHSCNTMSHRIANAASYCLLHAILLKYHK